MPQTHKIMLLEPEYRLRLGLKSALKSAGHEICCESASLQEALPLLSARQPELLLVAEAEGFHGLEFSRSFLKGMPVAVILMAGGLGREQAVLAAEAGLYAFLPRPVEPVMLLPSVEIACQRFREKLDLSQQTEELRDLLALRKTLDQAKGILMSKHHMSEQEAHRRIQRYAMHKRLTVKSVAEAIIKATGGTR